MKRNDSDHIEQATQHDYENYINTTHEFQKLDKETMIVSYSSMSLVISSKTEPGFESDYDL